MEFNDFSIFACIIEFIRQRGNMRLLLVEDEKRMAQCTLMW